jgi:thiol-disulfide isomerase/thioredoxin
VRRRELLSGAVGLGVLGAGAAYASGAFDSDGERIDPVTIETLDAPGSEADALAVPTPGEVTLLEFFATWCGVCSTVMPTLAEVRADRSDVQFVSVTNEPIGETTTRADVVAWWEDHEGSWPVGLDSDLDLTRTFEVSGVPTTVVIDAENRVSRAEIGRKSADELRTWIDDAG